MPRRLHACLVAFDRAISAFEFFLVHEQLGVSSRIAILIFFMKVEFFSTKANSTNQRDDLRVKGHKASLEHHPIITDEMAVDSLSVPQLQLTRSKPMGPEFREHEFDH